MRAWPRASDRSTGAGFIQGYNAQLAVDAEAQIIIAQHVTAAAPDVQQLRPSSPRLRPGCDANRRRCWPTPGTGPGPTSTPWCARNIEPFIATGGASTASRRRWPRGAGLPRTLRGQMIYARREVIVEPVFGQIRHARAFRQFLRRGVVRVGEEWALVCLSHDLLKLYMATA